MKRKPLQSFSERGNARVARTAFCGSLFGLSILAGAAEADPMIDFIIEQFQEQCDAEQANFRGIAEGIKAPFSMDLVYQAARDPEPRVRKVEPYGLLLGARQYLIARDIENARVYRRYRMDRITCPMGYQASMDLRP